MITLSIDPATHGCGVALFNDSDLYAAGYVRNDRCTDDDDIVRRCTSAAEAVVDWFEQHTEVGSQCVNQFVCELPQIYARGANKTKGDPNKIALPLAMVDAALAALLAHAKVISIQPGAWKGNTKKPDNTKGEYVIAARVKQRLTLDELKAVDWTKSVSRSWDVADAIGVGLTALGRFERHRVLARE